MKSSLLYKKDSIGCCSKASLGEGHGTCVCDSVSCDGVSGAAMRSSRVV